jgi:hypothetical protein
VKRAGCQVYTMDELIIIQSLKMGPHTIFHLLHVARVSGQHPHPRPPGRCASHPYLTWMGFDQVNFMSL